MRFRSISTSATIQHQPDARASGFLLNFKHFSLARRVSAYAISKVALRARILKRLRKRPLDNERPFPVSNFTWLRHSKPVSAITSEER